MKTVIAAIAAIFILNGAAGFAQDFAGADFYEGLRNAREASLPAAGTRGEGAQPAREDFPADNAAPAEVKDWTVMVFVNAKNDLEREVLSDINEMESVGSTPGVNLIVEMGRYSTNQLERYYVTRDTMPTQVSSRVLSTAQAVDMGDPAAVKNFVLWAEHRYPARKFLLIIWNHGSGWWKGDPVTPPSDAKGISHDWVTGHNIDTPQLGRLMSDIEAAGGRVDLLALDACLMQMAEVAYELKDSRVSHLAASEEIEPGSGYPYDRWLPVLAGNPGMGAAELGTAIAREYLAANPDGFQGKGLNYSVIELAKMRDLAAGMDALARAAMAAGDKAAVLRARSEATRYDFAESKDLRHFSQLLRQYSENAEVQAAAAGLERMLAVGQGPVVFNGVSARRPTLSHGLAAYIAQSGDDLDDYGELKLAADTQWDEFLAWLLRP
jgi:hypothetical protein